MPVNIGTEQKTTEANKKQRPIHQRREVAMHAGILRSFGQAIAYHSVRQREAPLPCRGQGKELAAAGTLLTAQNAGYGLFEQLRTKCDYSVQH